MAYVRGQERFVYQQFLTHLQDGMQSHLGWDGAQTGGRLPWDAKAALRWVETTPEVRPDNIKPNTIAVAEGDFTEDEELELGGSLVEVPHVFFLDVYGESMGIAKAIATDLRSLLNGRAGLPEFLPLYDWASPARPPLPGHLLRFDYLELSYPGNENFSRVSWAVVKVTVFHQYNV